MNIFSFYYNIKQKKTKVLYAFYLLMGSYKMLFWFILHVADRWMLQQYNNIIKQSTSYEKVVAEWTALLESNTVNKCI